MNTYKIEIRELYAKTIEIEANSIDEALEKAQQDYQLKNIKLDYVATEIDEYSDDCTSCITPFDN